MAGKEELTEKYIRDSQKYCRLVMCTKIHLKQALIDVLHNTMKSGLVNALPSDPKLLYVFMVHEKKTLNSLKKNKIIKEDQYASLFPIGNMININDFDITLIILLIRTFCITTNFSITNEPNYNDHSIVAAVWRTAGIRNQIAHYKDITSLNENEFDDFWNQIDNILKDLGYAEDISLLRTKSLDPDAVWEATKQFHANMAEGKKF